MAKSFFDTNVLVYLYATDEPAKRERSRAVLEHAAQTGDIVLSAQILQEFFVTVTRKSQVALSPQEAEEAMERFSRFHVIPADVSLVLAAIRRSRTSKISFWDSLVVEAARRAGCRTLYSEDLQDGWQVDGDLRVVNPFAPAAASTASLGPAQP